jgi:large subunit ribosomal protein L4
MAMAGKIKDEQVFVLDELSMESPQTKEIAGLLKALDLHGKSALITTAENDTAVYKSARNIQRVEVSRVSDLNALAILRPHRVLITRDALDAFKENANS